MKRAILAIMAATSLSATPLLPAQADPVFQELTTLMRRISRFIQIQEART